MKLIHLINMGGPINWVLAVILCICLCLCIERIIYFVQTRSGSRHDIVQRFVDKAESLKGKDFKDKQKELHNEGTLIYYEMNRYLWVLNFISAVAPSIGLLGTVTGLISAFQGMSSAGAQVNIQDLSGGIWEAMLTTAFGMIISIPALFCYRTFKRIIEKRLMFMTLKAQQE